VNENELKMNLGMHWIKWQAIQSGIHGLNEDMCKIRVYASTKYSKNHFVFGQESKIYYNCLLVAAFQT